MLTPILLLLAAPLLQDPAAPSLPAAANPAQQAWELLLKRLAAAQGLSLSASMELADSSVPPEDLMPVTMRMQLFLARPGAGTVSWTTVFGEGEDAETVVLEWIGTGEKVFAVDHEEKWVSAEGREWKDSELGFFLPFLGPTWSIGSMQAEKCSFLPPLADHPDWQGLQIQGDSQDDELGEEPTELQVWLGPDGMIRRAVAPLGGTAVMNFEITAMALAVKVDLKEYVAAIPEGYEVLEDESTAGDEVATDSSLEASLLPIGDSAPDALFIGMDDVEFTLASLHGKTVLLNFWFYH